jgi:hypothetical protein
MSQTTSAGFATTAGPALPQRNKKIGSGKLLHV